MANDRKAPADRRPEDRLKDHAAIDHLADELLPALVAKLGANGLGELEVREGTWRVRLRMPADRHAVGDRRASGGRQGGRAADGLRGEHSRTDPVGTGGSGSATAGSEQTADVAQSPGASRLIATAPAVGYFRPRANLRAGTKVRAGDRIGSVDVLGIGQDVVAPGDGLIGATLVGPGEPVEYGQGIIVLEQIGEPRAHGASATAPSAAGAESLGELGGSAGGAAEPGAAERGAAEPGAADLGAAEPGAAEPGAADPAAPEPGAAIIDQADPGAPEPGPVDLGPADFRPAGVGPAGAAAEGAAAEGAAAEGAAAEGAAAEGAAAAPIRPGGPDDSDGSSPAGAA